MGYTLRQFRAYLELAAKRERADMRWDLIASAAVQGDGKSFKALLDKLKD
jgi:hypothetical protein